MAVNWVMFDPSKGFINLPNEKRIYTSPPRTTLSITTPRGYPGNIPITLQSSAGTVYLTNQRIVYLPATSSTQLQSFSAPLTNLHDTHVTAPFFGPNVWYAVLQPVPGGGLTTSSSHIEVKMTFKDGGAYDFQTNFERVKERLIQAVEIAREGNLTGTTPVNLTSVNLDELPAYELNAPRTNAAQPSLQQASSPPPVAAAPAPAGGGTQSTARAPNHLLDDDPPVFSPHVRPQRTADDTVIGQQPTTSSPSHNLSQHHPASDSTNNFQTPPHPPHDPPPGYEEAQQQSIAVEFERRLSETQS